MSSWKIAEFANFGQIFRCPPLYLSRTTDPPSPQGRSLRKTARQMAAPQAAAQQPRAATSQPRVATPRAVPQAAQPIARPQYAAKKNLSLS